MSETFKPEVDIDLDSIDIGGEEDMIGEIVNEVEDDFLAPSKPQNNAVSNGMPEIKFDFSSLGIKGMVSGEIGLTVSRYAVDKMKFTKDSKKLISIVSDQVLALSTHYNEEVGSYICWGGKCCEIDGLPRIKYLLPIIVYETNSKGQPISKKLEYKCLALGPGVYEDIKTVQELNGTITDIDFLVTCKEEQYQDISLTQAGPAKWKKDAKLSQEVYEFWSQNLKELYKPVARQISEKDYLAKVGQDLGPMDSSIDFNDVFND